MSKPRMILLVVMGISLVYVMLSVFIKFLADTTVSVNAELAAAHNMTQYPGASGFLLASPWILYFAPAAIGIVLIVLILKRKPVSY